MARVSGFCTLCRSRCGTINTIEDGRLVKVEPDPSHPTGAAICAKGRAGPEIAHATNRLTVPLRRTAPKGAADPGWEPITWDAALDEVAARLLAIKAAHGAEAVGFAVTSPSGTPISDAIDWIERLIRVFGSPNTVYATEICNWHKDSAHAFTFGTGITVPDYRNAELILLWGHNPSHTWLAQAEAVAAGQKRGAKLMVVDPRRTGSAAQADHWLQLRPGTDAALALGLIREVIAQGGYDAEFVRRWTNAEQLVEGRPVFELLTEAVALWTPERTAAETGVPAAQIIAAARAIGASRATSYYCWTGVGQHGNATQTDRAIAILMALTGTWDVAGGNREIRRQPARKVSGQHLLPPGQAEKALGLAERPIGPPAMGYITADDLYTAVLEGRPYPVRALVGMGANMLVSQGDTARAEAALKALDFHVQTDLFETPTARFADILLPVSALWEREGLRIGFELTEAAEELVQLRTRMLEPQGQARSDLEITFALATRLGLGEHFFGGDMDAARNWQLEPLGIDLAALRARPEGIRVPLAQTTRLYAQRSPAFATESGLIELYSDKLLRHGQAPLPFHRPVPQPDPAFPLRLTTAKNGFYCHSQQRGFASLRRRSPDPVAEIAPEAAAARGITEGDWLVLATPAGEARFRARIDASLAADVVVAEYGWWQACEPLGEPAPTASSYNALVASLGADPISGSVPMRGIACEARRAGNAAWAGEMVVRALQPEAPDVTSVLLAAPDGRPLPGFLPGQYLPVTLGGVERRYSLSAAPADTYRLTVKRVPGGIGSGHVNDVLRVGDVLPARPPGGHFTMPVRAHFPLVLVAAGIGITPFMALLEAMVGQADAARVVLHYAFRGAAHEVFGTRLRELESLLPALTVMRHDSREGPRFAVADVSPDMIAARARFYLCGPPAMLRETTEALVARGVPRFDIFQEAFLAPPPAEPPPPDAVFPVRFARSGLDAVWRPQDGSLLDLAEAHGLKPPSGCRTGQCESCALRVIEGTARHLVTVNVDDPDCCLACQAVPNTALVIDA
ncbi:2Fe-2S iron-sulfur cluster binding domain-containing protein [Rhodovarius crocodyli]|uniref:2Fe-2S iron-sulfur cluster binding domain-containing protein n=1 Tax=Rhodovarius crocodyli TaxID=1979269 RepID=A0A437MD67_9PROT|nr:molybdopterin-dependent oxidoreductase [Rhodovarius crocodyli]RVT95575.1 2Fe-2S iron-sulfur cluster binding domain-containing protein [Rhodovarius crocodyli]